MTDTTTTQEDTGEPSMTGTYVHDYGADTRGGMRFEVRFAFEGERWFASIDDARAAAREYEKIVHDVYEDRDAPT